MQIADAISLENSIEPEDPRIIQIEATHYGCSKQNNLRRLSLPRVQKCTQAPSEIE